MKHNTLVKKLSLSEEDLAEIKTAIQKAESKSKGEIVAAVAAESSSYAFWELLASCLTAALFLLCLLPLAPQINTWLGNVFWGASEWYLVAFYILCGALMIALLYLLYNIPWFDNLVIPVSVKNAFVSKRAVRCFAESGVYCTENHSGILIFVSYFEKQVRIMADRGIAEKISQDLWNLIADDLSEGIGSGSVKEAFISAVERCGDLLAENFPVEEKDAEKKNELSDGLLILEDEKWA